MFELSAENAHDYLGFPCQVTPLGGGVSNTVLLIEAPGKRLVLKQSLGKLRVEQDWFSDRRRIFRESSAMKQIAPMLPRGSVPEILFEDQTNYLFGMTAAPAGAVMWKDQLMAGDVRPEIAEHIGQLLAGMVEGSRRNEAIAAEFAPEGFFEELRIDPYYRATALRHPDLAAHINDLIAKSSARRYSLVHGDLSPKNFLVQGNAVMAIDFEVIHFGDPSFDSAFLLNHLLLKAFRHPQHALAYSEAAFRFWSTIQPHLPDWFEGATIRHLGALLLARIDGKSPAEYIREAALQDKIRQFARGLILDPPATVRQLWEPIRLAPSATAFPPSPAFPNK